MPPSLDGTMPDSVISQKNNSPLISYIEFDIFCLFFLDMLDVHQLMLHFCFLLFLHGEIVVHDDGRDHDDEAAENEGRGEVEDGVPVDVRRRLEEGPEESPERCGKSPYYYQVDDAFGVTDEKEVEKVGEAV